MNHKLLAAAERVEAAVREHERRAQVAAAHPFAKHPEESARWHRLQRKRRLEAMARSLPPDGDPDG